MNKWLVIVAIVGLLAALRRSAWTLPSAGEPWREHFAGAEAMHGLPPNLLARVAQQESSYRPDVQSHAGAVGLMQIVPRWHPDANPHDPIDSIYYAGEYLSKLHQRFGTWSEALAAYNWGPTALSKNGLAAAPEETRNYVTEITGDLGIV